MTAPVTYIPNFVTDPQIAFEELWFKLDWERRENTPRMEYYANDVPAPYTYGRGLGQRTYQPKPWLQVMRHLQANLAARAQAPFEVCFINGYVDGSDQLGWHADNSPEMDDTRPIGIISLGAERDIMFRELGGEPDRLRLQHGSLCLMEAGMQDTHQHRIPKAGFVCGPRISLTFRGYVS